MDEIKKDDLPDTLSKVLFKMDLIEQRRKDIKKLSIIFTFISLGIISLFIFYVFQVTKKLDSTFILNQSLNSSQVKLAVKASFQKLSSKTMQEIKQQYLKHFINDTAFLKSIAFEADTFLQVASHNLSSQLTPLYIDLISKQKQHIYAALPEFQNHEKVHKAIDHLIEIGAPRLYEAFTNRFDEHKRSLISIYLLVKNMKDDSLMDLPSFEKAVLGITLELFGKILRKEGEKGELKND